MLCSCFVAIDPGTLHKVDVKGQLPNSNFTSDQQLDGGNLDTTWVFHHQDSDPKHTLKLVLQC